MFFIPLYRFFLDYIVPCIVPILYLPLYCVVSYCIVLYLTVLYHSLIMILSYCFVFCFL